MTEPEIGDVITIWNWGPNGPLNQRCHWAHVFDKSHKGTMVISRSVRLSMSGPAKTELKSRNVPPDGP
jgi:hypothetical protein